MDIDGDGSFLMNCQELATAKVERLDIKMFILNNQHLGMVVQWEDRFYKANRAHTYLGNRVSRCCNPLCCACTTHRRLWAHSLLFLLHCQAETANCWCRREITRSPAWLRTSTPTL